MIDTKDSDSDSDNCDLMNIMYNMFIKDIPEAVLYSAVFTSATVVLSHKLLFVPRVLFDSGALHGSYVSKNYINKHKVYFNPLLRSANITTRLADNKTLVRVDNVIDLTIEFKDSYEAIHSGHITLAVFDTGHDMIIGLPHILCNFNNFFKCLLDNAIVEIATPSSPTNTFTSTSTSTTTTYSPPSISTTIPNNLPTATLNLISLPIDDTINPWPDLPQGDAPEDNADVPCSFSYALHFMEMSIEDAKKEYFSMFDAHVCKEFAEATHILDLLREEGVHVFVPGNWKGIFGVEPLELKWKDTLPPRLKPSPRPINPKLYEAVKTEMLRLLHYMYVPCGNSESDYASCLVVAPKSTSPFIRLCGDYNPLNLYIVSGFFPIPDVRKSLDKIANFKVFLDFDWVNSFHQIPLGPITSARLSIQTLWGQFRPKFMPEGIGPASGILQSIVSELFSDFADWTIAIFDNLLVLANDYQDAYNKTVLILRRCRERNLFLKFSKTWLGFDHANFFGYICRYQQYELSQQRKDEVAAIPFPHHIKGMQSFLGSSNFFKSFMPSYSILAAPLFDMVKQDFPWSTPSSWSCDYRTIFDDFKLALQNATALNYPDYELEWILRTDASERGVAAVLLMQKPTENSDGYILLPIGFASQKFSPQATKWATIEQEAYGCYFGIHHFSYYLRCKPFILETDHNNLLWIASSAVPKIIRWRVYMQNFVFRLRHIPGKLNTVADYLSRMHTDDSPSPTISNTPTISNIINDSSQLEGEGLNVSAVATNTPLTPINVLRQVHNSRMGHNGVRRTYNDLNKYFPGHKIPYRFVSDFVMSCPICQKSRLAMTDSIEPLYRHLRRDHPRARVGVDLLTVTPPDIHGNQYLTVIVNHCTKHLWGRPSKVKDAIQTAMALFMYYCMFGMFEEISFDPGSENKNDIVDFLHKWLGIRQVFSLVDRPQSNGVEGSNKSILRHLLALVFDERVKNRWSEDSMLPIIFFIINSNLNAETGVVPFHAHFGSHDATYFKLPMNLDLSLSTVEYIRLLDTNLQLIRKISKEYQNKLILERSASNPSPQHQNLFQPGDYVLFVMDTSKPLPSKLHPLYLGPFEVIRQVKNDVECRNLIHGTISVFHVERLKIFHGTTEDAFKMAQIDNDQFVIDRLTAFRGDPLTRTTMEFEVIFADGSIVWLPWSQDLFQTIQYEDFCRSNPSLSPLLYTLQQSKREIQLLNNSPITSVNPGVTVFVDLRSYGASWYAGLNLPNPFHTQYVLESFYLEWCNRNHTKIKLKINIFDEVFKYDHFNVRSYGSQRNFDPSRMVLIDRQFVLQYPQVLPESTRDVLLARYRR